MLTEKFQNEREYQHFLTEQCGVTKLFYESLKEYKVGSYEENGCTYHSILAAVKLNP